MDVDYQLRHRNGGALFKLHPSELHRRLRYLDNEVGGELVSRERPDTRPGIDEPETIFVLTGPGREVLVAVKRHDEARLQGHASLTSEPAAMSAPRSAEALISFAEKAKDGGNYGAANAAFALVLHEHFPRIECSLSVREKPKTPTGEMTDGYYDLAYVQPSGTGADALETCIPVPKLRGEVAYWFATHARRREPQPHNREPAGPGPTIDDLEGMRGRKSVQEAAQAILSGDALGGRYGAEAGGAH
jgi:hypothetical protein